MKKYCKALSIALALFMVLNVIAPMKAEAKKTTCWLETEVKTYAATYQYDSETGEMKNTLELFCVEKLEYNSKGQTTKHTSVYYGTDYETGEKTENTEVTKYTYKKGTLYKILRNDGSYCIYTWKKNNITKEQDYDKDNKLESVTTYTYNAKGQMMKQETKRNGKLSYVCEYKNGLKKKNKVYNENGKLSQTTVYDKYGNELKTDGTLFDSATGKKRATYVRTFKNTYKKGELAKVVEEYVTSDGWKQKTERTYYTSGKLTGLMKTYASYSYDKETGAYTLSSSETSKYKLDSHNNLVEMTETNEKGEVIYKRVAKYKKFTY